MERLCLDNLAGLMRQSPSSKSFSKDTLNATADKRPTLFDICSEDRNRILKLIEELLDTQEDTEKLRQKLDEERVGFKEKRSVYIKKLDQLSERYEKALSDNQLLKERYCDNLKQLEDKISIVSNKLEASVVEIRHLRQINADLVNENTALRKQNQEAAHFLAFDRNDNSKITIQTNGQRRKEKRHRKQVRVNSNVQTCCEKEKSTLEKDELACDMNPGYEQNEGMNKRSGAGDFTREKNLASASIETIKAPAIVIFDKNMQSALNLTSDTKNETKKHLSHYNLQKKCSLNFHNDLEDITLLENLFFRF